MSVRVAVVAFIASLALSLAALGVGAYVLTHKTQEGSETHEAVCALVADLEDRTDGTKTFLAAHPQGIPGLASGSQLRESLHNQERTLAALSVITCS